MYGMVLYYLDFQLTPLLRVVISACFGGSSSAPFLETFTLNHHHEAHFLSVVQ